jgi:Ser/Thr protein kinase RdoA (MazF antagonist)
MDHTLLAILDQFFSKVEGHVTEIVLLKSGLINETYRVKLDTGANSILQRINTEIFKNPQDLQENCQLISTFLSKRSDDEMGTRQLILTPVPTRTGKLFFQAGDQAWRMFPFFDHTDCFEIVPSIEHAFQAAKALAQFHRSFSEFDTHELIDPIPNFLNFSARLEQYQLAKETANADRLRFAEQEIHQINELLPELQDDIKVMDQLSKRVIHADPKISNFLYYENSTSVAGMIDWDTIMQGSILYDIGDMVRSFTNRKREDEDDSEPTFDAPIFDALLAGYMEESTHLSNAERENLIVGTQTVIAIQAIRFLTDYLNGDVYYSVTDSHQNLRRTLNQLQLFNELNNHVH